MRLICPNCGAQYEVDPDVIPSAGRDVQCSNCGHTWFELPGASEAAEAEAEAQADAASSPQKEVAPPEPGPVASVADPVAPAPQPAQAQEEPELKAAPRRPEPPRPDVPVPQRPPLDDAIADMLREEAAREEAMRAAEAEAGLESQQDLGLDTIPTMTPEKRAEAEARVGALTGQAAVATAEAAAPRRELLPDIEDINATLRSDAERDSRLSEPSDAIEEKRSFRFGFTMVLTFFVVLLALYLLADQISAALPGLEPTVSAYVDMVDNMRLWLDAQLENVAAMLEPSDSA